MLLTGDARGDDILFGLTEAGLLGANGFAVDLLKVPHHGSDRNVTTEFFRRVRAKHYVVSGDGEHGNPEIATLRMIVDARGASAYTVHATHRTGIKGLGGRLTAFLASLPAATRAKFRFRVEDALALEVSLT
jgi:beta-lactamase superfamily II metal-dependent hydrolase